ncbi:Na+/melibiose symporter [Thalassotalea agarivorans]|uniref:Na+/melibiose symporter n=2 Tax=Thalassotalea agarivorans TaxID=349064 RepID=A0A1I0C0Q2_THASX|nr:Na+/melibiose symporter [Thalassotalea agarivorans]
MEKAAEILAIPFYQMTLGVDPVLFNFALMVPLFVSTILSPVVGKLSDNCESRFGRRKPFIFAFAILSAVLFGLIWMVPQDWTSTSQFSYFLCLSVLFHCCVCFYNVPLTSLSYEITSDHEQRIKVMEINSYFIKLASFSSQWLYPLAALALFGSIYLGVKVVGWSVAIFIITLMGIIPALVIPDRKVDLNKSDDIKTSMLTTFKQIIEVPLMKLVCLIIFLQVGIAAYAAKMDYYVLVYLMFEGDIAQGTVWKAVLSTAYAISAAIYIPIVSLLSRRYGKLNALQVIFVLTAIGGIVKWFIYEKGNTWLIILDPIFCSAIWSSMTIIIPALIAQASDNDEKHKTTGRAGGFAALHHMVLTFSIVFALLITGLSLNGIGFDANLGAAQPLDALYCMKIILSLGTVIPALIALFLIARYREKYQHLHLH